MAFLIDGWLDGFSTMSLFWSIFGFMAFIRPMIPPEVLDLLYEWRRRLIAHLSPLQPQLQFHIPEFFTGGSNELYPSVHRYLATLSNAADSLSAACAADDTRITLSLAANQCLDDSFRSRPMKWEHLQTDTTSAAQQVTTVRSSYTLTVTESDRKVAADYLAFVLERGRELRLCDQRKYLYSNVEGYWNSSLPFSPPPTFDTIAMEPGAKKALVNDLGEFMQARDYYASIGRAWKRGYLLYGPPGTGKSSVICAMANFTGYNVYDLELTKVGSNFELRELLIGTGNRAIIVVEDIDCSVYLPNREEMKNSDPKEMEYGREKITLSGLLNFTDGLLSSSGRERIFVFTTNYIDRLDPALIRSGRMDMHICMSYCTFPIFKSLVEIYFKISDGSADSEAQKLTDRYFPQIEALLAKVEVSPADVVEMLVRHKLDPNLALEEVVETLKKRNASTQM